VCKKSITNSQPFVKKNEKMSGPIWGDLFLTHTVYNSEQYKMLQAVD